MSALVVVDASVALKWVAVETGSTPAGVLLAERVSGVLALAAPEHLVGRSATACASVWRRAS